MSDVLRIEDLTLELLRSPRRKTVGITIARAGELSVAAPVDCPLDTIEVAVRRKLPWIYRKLSLKRDLRRSLAEKEFVPGEGFAYLGRSYRLALIDAPPEDVSVPALRLRQGRFLLLREERQRGHEHFEDWYTAHATPWLSRRVDLLSDRCGAATRGIVVREIGNHWGICDETGVLHFHWRTILLPPRIIEYIVVHELVHLIEPNHGTGFWRRVERVVPDYEERKAWLATWGGRS
ncbi:MAG: M48 family metallopeptidase [Thermomicrobiales bacterium]